MKTNILTYVFLILTSTSYCQTSNKSYLDFFGKKYFLSDTLFSEPGVSYYFEPQKKPFKYKLCGKHFLNEKKEKYMYGENKNFFVLKTFNNISNCLDFYNVVDSVQIITMNKEMDFKIVDGKNDYKILGFKIIADSIDYVIVFSSEELKEIIETIRPDILTKGSNYTEDEVVEHELIEQLGGRVVLIPVTEEISTTRIINNIKGSA